MQEGESQGADAEVKSAVRKLTYTNWGRLMCGVCCPMCCCVVLARLYSTWRWGTGATTIACQLLVELTRIKLPRGPDSLFTLGARRYCAKASRGR